MQTKQARSPQEGVLLNCAVFKNIVLAIYFNSQVCQKDIGKHSETNRKLWSGVNKGQASKTFRPPEVTTAVSLLVAAEMTLKSAQLNYLNCN